MHIDTLRNCRLASCILLLSCTFCLTLNAQTPTAAQIEQFKRLPPSQQRSLAASMGINLSDIEGLISQQGAPKTEVAKVSGARVDKKEEAQQGALTGDDSHGPSASRKLAIFGHNLFKFGADSFTPANDIPVPANYIVGPGDSLEVQLYGKESASFSLIVSRDGKVQFPDIGPISLGGLSYARAVEKIEEVVSEQMIGIKSSVTMGQLRTIRIFVMGEVKVPGSYVVGSLSTMTNALFASGGISDIGSLRNIALKRNGKTVTTLDLYDLLLKGDTSNDSRLLPGDVLFVPTSGKMVGVNGAVKRPAIYELKSETSVSETISLAGGLLASAYAPSSNIERLTSGGDKTLIDVPIQGAGARKFRVRDADLITIASALDEVVNTVTLAGHVRRPASYAWKKGMRISDILRDVNDLVTLPDLDLGLVQRETDSSREIKVFSFSPSVVFDSASHKDNLILNANDKVIVFGFEKNRTETLLELVEKLKLQASYKNNQQLVRVDGSVRFPGEYPLTKDMTPSQLISLAGGFTESALGTEAEITRYEFNDNRERVVIHIQADLGENQSSLEAGDILRVKQIPLWAAKERVTLTGEFVHPGIYAILPGETLLDVIQRAGGLTAQAFPEGTIFSRAELRELEEARLAELKDEVEKDIAAAKLVKSDTAKDIDRDDAEQIIENLDRTSPLGRMVINLPSVLRQPDQYNFQLVEGDSIYIPRYKPSVTVVGEVQYGTSHFYDKAFSYKDYIDRSGGYKRNADKKRVYIVRANGEVYIPRGHGWFGNNRAKLQPGDTIIVPIHTRKVDRLTLWGSITQILANTAISVATIARL